MATNGGLDYLIIQGAEHKFCDNDGLLRSVDRAFANARRAAISYCRHVGFRFVIPRGFNAIGRHYFDTGRLWLGRDVAFEARYVDECERWGSYYSPRQFTLKEYMLRQCLELDSHQLDWFRKVATDKEIVEFIERFHANPLPLQLVASEVRVPIHDKNSLYLSQITISATELRERLEHARIRNEDYNLLPLYGPPAAGLFFSHIEEGMENGSLKDLGNVAAAWDYWANCCGMVLESDNMVHMFGYEFDRFDPSAGKVAHHVSSFAGFPVIYIPLNKMFEKRAAFEPGLNYLKGKFLQAKQDGVLSPTDAQAIIIERNPENLYEFAPEFARRYST